MTRTTSILFKKQKSTPFRHNNKTPQSKGVGCCRWRQARRGRSSARRNGAHAAGGDGAPLCAHTHPHLLRIFWRTNTVSLAFLIRLHIFHTRTQTAVAPCFYFFSLLLLLVLHPPFDFFYSSRSLPPPSLLTFTHFEHQILLQLLLQLDLQLREPQVREPKHGSLAGQGAARGAVHRAQGRHRAARGEGGGAGAAIWRPRRHLQVKIGKKEGEQEGEARVRTKVGPIFWSHYKKRRGWQKCERTSRARATRRPRMGRSHRAL